MKKLFSTILVLGFLLSGNAYSAEYLTKEDIKRMEKELTSIKITNDWLRNKTVTDLKKSNFFYGHNKVGNIGKNITTTEDSVQYYLYRYFKDENINVIVICFVDPKKTICRLP